MYGKTRENSAVISIYMIAETGAVLVRVCCMFCQRPICEVNAGISKVINAPVPSNSFGTSVRIRCKLCKQNYDMISEDTYTQL